MCDMYERERYRDLNGWYSTLCSSSILRHVGNCFPANESIGRLCTIVLLIETLCLWCILRLRAPFHHRLFPYRWVLIYTLPLTFFHGLVTMEPKLLRDRNKMTDLKSSYELHFLLLVLVETKSMLTADVVF